MNNKYFDLLPVQHQTSVNKNFFESTIEQLFSKSNLETINGYIGRKIPGVDNNTNTVFVEQPAPNREYYNLEPTVTTIDPATGKQTNFVFYEDFIFGHRTNGGLVGNHDRLFSTEQYNFAPPIDFDKFTNYQNYYWLASGPEPIEVLGNATVSINIDDVVGKRSFISPNNVTLKSGMIVQFTGSYVTSTDYEVGKSYIVEGVGNSIYLVDLPTAELSVSAYGEFKTQPYDGNAVPNVNSNGSYSNTDPISSSVLSNILTTANTLVNNTVYEFTVDRPARLTANGSLVTATANVEYMAGLSNGDTVRINVFDKKNKVFGDRTSSTYGFIGAYLTLADGSLPNKTIDLSATFSNGGKNIAVDNEVYTNKIYLNNTTDIQVGVGINHPETGGSTVTTVNSDHVVLSHSVSIYNNSNTSIEFNCLEPQFSINTGSGAKTITLNSGTYGLALKGIDLTTYNAVANTALIVSPLDIMDAINDEGIANLNVSATSNSLKITELNGNAVTITSVTNDARNNSFLNVTGLDGFTKAIEKANVENQTFAISNVSSTTFTFVMGGSDTSVLQQSHGTFINYGSNISANTVQLYSTEKTLSSGNVIFFDKTIGSITQGNTTTVVGTPELKTFFISTGETGYGGAVNGSGNFTQPRNGKFGLADYPEFLDANGSIISASTAYSAFDSANIETLLYDVSASGSLLTYAWDAGTYDNTPIQNVPDYMVQKRGAKNKNPWSRLNYWYHVDTLKEPLADNEENFSIPPGAIRAVRPIIEFDRDLELQNWGNSFITTVDIIADKNKSELEGLSIGFPINSSSGNEGDKIIFPNDETDIAGKIYEIVDSSGNISFSEVTSLTNLIVTGGHVFSTGGTNAGKDYFWTGTRWQSAQQKIKLQQPPLFTLYDNEGVKVDNIAKYPNSDFVGCPIFTYRTSTNGVYDSVLKANIVYQTGKFSSEPTFVNHLSNHSVTYKATLNSQATEIGGMLFFKDLNQDYEGRDNAYLRSVWHPVSIPTNYRDFSNVATYKEGEVVKLNNNYFVANSNITAGNFDLSNYKYYEDVYNTTSKQYVEDVIQINDVNINGNIFITSAIPYNNDIYVNVNGKSLTLNKDFEIVTNEQGIKFDSNVKLVKGDIVNVKTYTKKDRLTNTDAYGFFEIPGVLKYNPNNTPVLNVSFADTISHFHNIISNQVNFAGQVAGSNNFKDTQKDRGLTQSLISQTADDILSPMYLSKSETRDFISALRFANNEYNKYKNRFISSAETYLRNNDYLSQTNLEIIDTILKTLKSSKISLDAHKLSFMAPIGNNYDLYSETITDATDLTYSFSNTVDIADDTVLYILLLNNNVLVSEKDFTVTSTAPFEITLTSEVTLAEDDVLELRVYSDSEPSLVPISMSKAGMYPCFIPQFKTDTSYRTPKDVIQCHDGSYVIRQNDKIDDIILAYETIIYNNIKKEFRTEDCITDLWLSDIRPSAYCETDYEWYETNLLLEKNFNQWARATGLDFRTNELYDSNSEWTWNYNADYKSPGHWRGIYEYYYDTQTPDTTPWEMFGFIKKPSWWDLEYTDDITSTYTAFWNNVRDGYIPRGEHKGYWKRWARPNVIIPVDANGVLLSPQDIIYTSESGNNIETQNNWKFGDGAPVEYAWKKSSYYPFAVAETLYLAKPAKYFAVYMQKDKRVRTKAQYAQIVHKDTYTRIGHKNFKPHGYIDTDNVITTKFGISAIIDAYLKFQSLSTNTEYGDPFITCDTNLGHKFGGFINDKNLKVYSDSISVDGFSAGQRIPTNDVITTIHTSAYNSRNYYTGVKIIKTANGYTVTGYDSVSRKFDIIPSDKNGAQQGVSEGGDPVGYATFDSSKSYLQNAYIKLGSTYYQAKENVNAGNFDVAQWKRLTELPTVGGVSATLYQFGLDKTEKVPYGIHYDSAAEVFDLMISLGRYQRSVGFDFGEFDSAINDVNDWLLSARRFLFWASEERNTNDVITLSPMAQELNFVSSTGKISKIQNATNQQYSIVDSDHNTVNVKECSIIREDNTIKISPIESGIFGCLIHTELVEHAVVFSNRTEFNDLLYDNVLGVRQDRLEINTLRTKDWDGRYSAPGMLLSEAGVMPNFDLLVDSIKNLHNDSSLIIDQTKTEMARNLIGFDSQQSLANIKLSDSAQYEFYKGSIKNKGTANAVTGILRSNIVNTNKDIEVYEEWAVRRGEFGDIFNHQSMDINLRESDFKSDNQQVQIVYPENITGAVSNIFVYERNTTYFKVPTIEIDPPSGGGNAAQATAKLYSNALLESVTVTSGGDGYNAKPNVAVITGNIVIARVDDVFHYGLAFSDNNVDVPLTGTSALSNITLTDYTKTPNTTVDVDLANSKTIEHVVTQINTQLSNAAISNIVAFGDIDSDVEKYNISSVSKGTQTINSGSVANVLTLTTSTAHGFNAPSVHQANGTITSFTSANTGVITFDVTDNPYEFSTGDLVVFEEFTGTGWENLNLNTYYLKSTGTDREFEVYTNKSLTAPANTSTYPAYTLSGEAHADANVDLIKLEGFGIINNGDYYARRVTATTFFIFNDPALRDPVTSTNNVNGDSGTATVYRTGGYQRLYIRGSDFQLAESTLPGGNPSTSLSVLNMTAGRYQPKQRWAIQTANNTTKDDIIVTIGGSEVSGSYYSFDNGNRTIITPNAGQITSKISSDTITCDLTGTGVMLNENITEIDGQYPFVEFYIDGKEIKNTPTYRAITVTNPNASTTRVVFSNISQYANSISLGSNITIAEMGTVQFLNTLVTDKPGAALEIKSVANDTLIANTISKRTYTVTEDSKTDNKITIDVDNLNEMLKRPTNTLQKGVWPTTNNTTFTIPNAGYVNRDSVEWEAFDIQTYANLIGSGKKSNPLREQYVHLAKGENEDWNVYQLKRHTIQTPIGPGPGAQNYVDTVNGQTQLYSNRPLSRYLDGNKIDNDENRFYDNHIVLRNVDLSNVVLKWANERIIATPRTIFTGDYIPLKPITRKIVSFAPGATGNISQAKPVISDDYTNIIYGKLMVPLANVEYFRKAAVQYDRTAPTNPNNNVIVTVENISGVSLNVRDDRDGTNSIVRFYGSAASNSNITIGKAYDVVSTVFNEGGRREGAFVIQEANITTADFCALGSNCYVAITNELTTDATLDIVGIDPSANRIKLHSSDVSYLSNGENVSISAEYSLSSVDSIPDNYYSISGLDAVANTYNIVSSNLLFHNASVSRTAYSTLSFAGVGNADGFGNSYLIGSSSDQIQIGDFVEFVSGTNYAGNVYPITDLTSSGIATIYDPNVTSNSASQNAVVYSGTVTSKTGDIEKLYANGVLQINNFDTTSIGNYGHGKFRYLRSNSTVGKKSSALGLTNKDKNIIITNTANTVLVDTSDSIRSLKTSFRSDVVRQTNDTTQVDVALRESASAGDIGSLIFKSGTNITENINFLEGSKTRINYGFGSGQETINWSSKYQGKPMYIGALSNKSALSMDRLFDSVPESLGKVNSVKVKLEFRYVTTEGLYALENLTSEGNSTGYKTTTSRLQNRLADVLLDGIVKDFEDADGVNVPDINPNGTYSVALDKLQNVDWWVRNKTIPLKFPSLDGMSMKLFGVNGSGQKTTPLDLIPRYPGEHNSYDLVEPVDRYFSISGTSSKLVQGADQNIVEFTFSDRGATTDAFTAVDQISNKSYINDIYLFGNNDRNLVWTHTGQKNKARAKLVKNHLLPSTPTASNNPMSWWSNDLKNTLTQNDNNVLRFELGYEDGVTTYPLSGEGTALIPVVIVHDVEVEYSLSPVTKIQLDNFRVSLKGGSITNVLDRKVTHVDPGFFTIDNSDGAISADDITGNVRAVLYKIDSNNNKQILVNDFGSNLKRSETGQQGYSSALLTTSNANSMLQHGNVFAYMPTQAELISPSGTFFLGIPNTSTTSISSILDNDFNASIQYFGLNHTGSTNINNISANITVDTKTYTSNTKLFGDVEGLTTDSVTIISDTLHGSSSGIAGQHNVSNIGLSWFSITAGPSSNVADYPVTEDDVSSISVIANSSINKNTLTINNSNHDLKNGSRITVYTGTGNILNNTSFVVKDVTDNTFTIKVANTSVMPTSNLSTFTYGAIYNARGVLRSRHHDDTTSVASLIVNDGNNVFEPGDTVRYYAEGVDTGNLNGNTSLVVSASAYTIDVVLPNSAPTAMTPNLTLRDNSDLNRNVIRLPSKYMVNDMYGRIHADTISWGNFEGYKEVTLKTYDEVNNENFPNAEFNAFLGNVVPTSEYYLPITTYNATKFVSKGHAIGKRTKITGVISTSNANASGYVNVVLKNSGKGLLDAGNITFSNSINNHVLSGNTFQIQDFVTIIDEDGTQGDQYVSIIAPGATATNNNEFSVSYVSWQPDTTRSLRLMGTGKYNGFGTPTKSDPEGFIIETPYMGNVNSAGHWVNDIILVEGTTDLGKELKLRKKRDAILIKGSKNRYYNNQFRIAPDPLMSVSPKLKGAYPTTGNVVPVFGFARSHKKVDVTEDNVSYLLEGWNKVDINGSETPLVSTGSIRSVADSINFAAKFKEGSIRKIGSVEVGFLFGKRNYKVDNLQSKSYNHKYVQTPKDMTNMEMIYSSDYVGAQSGNVMDDGVNRYIENVTKKSNAQSKSPSNLKGSYMIDIDNLEDMVAQGHKRMKNTKIGGKHAKNSTSTLDSLSKDNRVVKETMMKVTSDKMRPDLVFFPGANTPQYGSPHLHGDIRHYIDGHGCHDYYDFHGWGYEGYRDGWYDGGYYGHHHNIEHHWEACEPIGGGGGNPPPPDDEGNVIVTPPPGDEDPGDEGPECGSFQIELQDVMSHGGSSAPEQAPSNTGQGPWLGWYGVGWPYSGWNYWNYGSDGILDGYGQGNYGDYWGRYEYDTEGYPTGDYSTWQEWWAAQNGQSTDSETAETYNQATVDLCDVEPGETITINENLCTNSGEQIFLGGTVINLPEGCDPCTLVDAINSQGSDYRALCTDGTPEMVSCMLDGGGQGWARTSFGEYIHPSSGNPLMNNVIKWNGKSVKVKQDNKGYLEECYADVGAKEQLSVEIMPRNPGDGFGELIKQAVQDKGIDVQQAGLKSIVIRCIMSSNKKGDFMDKSVMSTGSGTKSRWYDIKEYGKDTVVWENVNWTDMIQGQGLNLAGASFRVKGWKPGISVFDMEVFLSSKTGNALKDQCYRLSRSGSCGSHGSMTKLGTLAKGIVFAHTTKDEMCKFEKYTDENNYTYDKIVGYGEKMGDPTKGDFKDRTWDEGASAGTPESRFFHSLWEIVPKKRRRKEGCTIDIDVPKLSSVKIKSALPFSLAKGCSRSPYAEVADFMPFMEKTITASANLSLADSSIDPESLYNMSLNSDNGLVGFSIPKVLTTELTGNRLQIADGAQPPSVTNPFMTADYLRISGVALTPRSGEGVRSGEANVPVQTGQVADGTGFNYRIGDKLTIVGGQPKTLDKTAYYLDRIEILNSGKGYDPANTRFEIVQRNGSKLPGVSVRANFAPDSSLLEPALKVTGRSASAYFHSYYREYIEQGGNRDTEWINDKTVPQYADIYTSAIEDLNIDLMRADVAIEALQGTTNFTVTPKYDLTSSREYRMFIGTRDYENAGQMMMFALGFHDQPEYSSTETAEELTRNSKIFDSFDSFEINDLLGSWICVFKAPPGLIQPNGHAMSNYENLVSGTKGVLKVFHDGTLYDEDTRHLYQNFLSSQISRFNGRILQFLKIKNGMVYFKIETTLGLEENPNFEAYGLPDFTNLWARFYPIEGLSNWQDEASASYIANYEDRDNALEISVSVDTAKSRNVTAVGTNGFIFDNNDDAQLSVKITATRDNTDPGNLSPIDQNYDVFFIQEGVDEGYLRMPFMVHVPIMKPDEFSESGDLLEDAELVPAQSLANGMSKIHYSTSYRPIHSPYVKMGESEALVYKFDFKNIPDDAIVENIDIDFILRSSLPSDFGMIWLQAPNGDRIPLMQFLGQYGSTGQYDQGGFMPGYDYIKTSGNREFIFTVSSRADAQTVEPGGTNLNGYGAKVKPWVGNWQRQQYNYGRDLKGIIPAGDYDSNNGEQLTDTTDAYWNEENNILRKWINKQRKVSINGSWYVEITRPGRNFQLVNETNSIVRPDGAGSIGITPYTTAVKAPNIKISYSSPSEDPNYDTAQREIISSIDIIQRGGFQPEFAMHDWTVNAIGPGEGFKGRAILTKGDLLGEDNQDLIQQNAHFEVTEINSSGSITKLRILDRGVYEIFPAEQERGVPLKYVDDKEAQARVEGPGYGGRVLLSSRSVIDCRQPPSIVPPGGISSTPETAVDALADAINGAFDPDAGIKATVVDINPSTQILVLTSDADNIRLSDIVPGTLEGIGLLAGDYGPNAIGFRADVGNPSSDFGVGDANKSSDNPFAKSGDGDNLVMYNTNVPPEFEGLRSSNYGTTYRYDLYNVDNTSVFNDRNQSNVEVLYFESKRFESPYSVPNTTTGKTWIDKYDATGWAELDAGRPIYRQQKLIDSSMINKALVYDKDTSERTLDLILHDPFKGYILPEADRNLDYISDSDPVYYNNDGSNFSKHNLGELWWNTNSYRLRWYEQGDNEYRAKYWGSTVYGSRVEVYEWIESDQIPSEYTGEGTPFSVEHYLVDQIFIKSSNRYVNKYYYWVRNLQSVPKKKGRTISARQVAALIASPKREGVPTYGVISNDTMLLRGVKQYITEENSALQINFNRKDTKYDNKHESYILLGENSELSRVPSDLYNKFIDSISGEDINGFAVPDKYLNKFEMYGVKVRPRQTMFKNVTGARSELRSFLNKELSKLILTNDQFKNWDKNIATSNLYKNVDWVETGYNNNDIKSRLVVNSYKDMLGLTGLTDNVFVKVKGVNRADRVFEYQSADGTFKLVKVFGGTIEINKDFYQSAQSSVFAKEVRQLLTALSDNVFANTNTTNRMYFCMLNYILTEQYQTDWFFKTSYFNIRQSADNLEQKVTTKIDPFGDMKDYIKTIKPYTSKLRDFNDRKTNLETINSFATDFDKPPYQPNLSITATILDPGNGADANILSTDSEYVNWSNTHITEPTKIRTFTEKIHLDRNQSNIMALGNSSVSTTLAYNYNQPTSFTAEDRMDQLLTDSANATPINHIERLFVYHPTITTLNEQIANTSFSNEVITGLKATRNTTLRILAYAGFQGEELDANLFSKAYFDAIGSEITATVFGYDQTKWDAEGFDSDVVVNNYLANAALDSELVRSAVTYAGFDADKFFSGFVGPERPPEHVLLRALEGVQFNVQSGSSGANANVSYKIFLGLNGSVEYIRMGDNFKTTLATAITSTTDEIYLTDATKVSSPYTGGSETAIFIGDERITYEGVDGDRLYGVRRGTQGTSAESHIAGTKVVDASEPNKISKGSLEFGVGGDPELAVWNNANTSLADSNTIIAQFLRDEPGSYFG